MTSFEERLTAMKAKQEAGDKNKKETGAEQTPTETEAKRTELQADRERVQNELAQSEQSAIEAQNAVKQAEAFALEQGENLDAEAKVEIDAIKAEAEGATKKINDLKAEIIRIDNGLSMIGNNPPTEAISIDATDNKTGVETPTKIPAEKLSDKKTETTPEVAFTAEPTNETNKDVRDQTPDEKYQSELKKAMDELSQNLNGASIPENWKNGLAGRIKETGEPFTTHTGWEKEGDLPDLAKVADPSLVDLSAKFKDFDKRASKMLEKFFTDDGGLNIELLTPNEKLALFSESKTIAETKGIDQDQAIKELRGGKKYQDMVQRRIDKLQSDSSRAKSDMMEKIRLLNNNKDYIDAKTQLSQIEEKAHESISDARTNYIKERDQSHDQTQT